MIRCLRVALVVAAALAVAVAATVPAVAAAPGPKGTLTAVEYSQLNAEQAAFKKLRHNKRLTWKQLYAACRTVGRSTQLLAAVHANCETGIGIERSLYGFYADIQRCAALSTGTTTGTTTTPTGTTTTPTGTTTTPTGTTTTGTTTTGTGTTTTGTATGTTTTGTGTTTTPTGLSPTDIKLFACLQPEYSVMARAFKAVYAGEMTVRARVLARHFVGRCLLTLAPSTADLGILKRVVATARQLAADVELITQVADGSAPASSVNGTQVQADALSFDKAAKGFLTERRPQKLSVCPHQ